MIILYCKLLAYLIILVNKYLSYRKILLSLAEFPYTTNYAHHTNFKNIKDQ